MRQAPRFFATNHARENQSDEAKVGFCMPTNRTSTTKLLPSNRSSRSDPGWRLGDEAYEWRVFSGRACRGRAGPGRCVEISPTGLLFGSRVSWASGEPGDIERAVVAELNETPESLKQAAAKCGFRGERRSLRVCLDELEWSLKDRTLTISYALPPGSYATSVLRELMKTDELQPGTR